MGEMTRVDDIYKMAVAVAKSGLFGMKDENQALALMLLAQAEGLHPMRAVQEYHIINGRPALRADAMLARFQQAGGRVEWHRLDNECADATFSHPSGGSVRIKWTLEDARRAGLVGKPGGDNWNKFPRAMLRSRCVSEGIRTVYPGVVAGIYTPEEVSAFEPAVEVTAVTEQTSSVAALGSGEKPSKEQVAEIGKLLNAVGFTDKGERRDFCSWFVSRALDSVYDLSKEEADSLIALLKDEETAEGKILEYYTDKNRSAENDD